MKKIFATVLALMLALTGLAYAEPVLEIAEPEAPFTLVRFFVEATETTPAYESYALLGAGDGQDAFALYGEEGVEGAEIYGAVWQNILTKLQSAITIEGAFESLIFTTAMDAAAQVEKTIVLMNGETVLEVEGLAAFVMLPASLGAVVPQIDAKCAAYIWTPEGLYVPAEICENCGAAKIGDSHTTEISQFCKQNHTLCMGNPIHECDGCGRSYECSASGSHTKCIKCGELWCYKAEGNHKEEACGHRGCEIYGEEEKHEKCVACGKFLCNGKDHELEACGVHHKGEAGDHSEALCGVHFVCDGKEHVGAGCDAGHMVCDGNDHSAADCGEHYVCDGNDHSTADCGEHYVCDGKDHSAALCGEHYVCDGKDHSQAVCGEHYVCAGGDHGVAECGIHHVCAEDNFLHEKCTCGEYDCIGVHDKEDCNA